MELNLGRYTHTPHVPAPDDATAREGFSWIDPFVSEHAVSFIVEHHDVQIDRATVVMMPNRVRGGCEPHVHFIETRVFQHVTCCCFLLTVDNNIQITVFSRLSSEESIDTPAAINPELYPFALKKAEKGDDISFGYPCVH